MNQSINRLIIQNLCIFSGPHWLKNLFFTYLLALRAVIKAAPYWKEVEFYTGDLKEDMEVKKIVMELVNTAQYVCHFSYQLVSFSDILCIHSMYSLNFKRGISKFLERVNSWEVRRFQLLDQSSGILLNISRNNNTF